MHLPRPTIVLFDMDGTTVRHVNPRVLNWLERLDNLSFKLVRLFRRRQAANTPLSVEDLKPKRLLVHRALHKVRRKPVDQIVQPCPGIYTVLDLLREVGIPIGICSNGLGKGYGHEILDAFDLEKYYVSQTFREDFAQAKPNPEPLCRALQKIRDPLTENDVVWHIGDRHKDIVAALAADKILPAKIVPIAYGPAAAVAVLEHGLGPDHITVNYQDFALRIKALLDSASEKAA